LIETHLGKRFHHIYLSLKSAWVFFLHEAPRVKLFLRIIRDNKIDLIHTFSNLHRGKSEIVAAKLAGIPCITHRQGYINYTRFDTLFAGFVNANIYISNDVAEYYIAQGESRAKGKIIHNWVNLSDFKKSPDVLEVRKEFDCKSDQMLVGLVGRLDWWKGHEFFLEAMAEIVNKNYNIKGLIIGGLAELNYDVNSRYLEKLHGLVKSLGLEENVIFTGHRRDIPRLVASLDVLVHASSTPEPFGVVIIEGMAAGKPVVATAAGGVLDIIEDGVNGLLVPCKDSNAMAKAIIKLLSDRNKAEQMGLAAHRRVAEKFTLQQKVFDVQKLYESILGITHRNKA
jgi:glycosyltransferase involved in cell wall biosynthesis